MSATYDASLVNVIINSEEGTHYVQGFSEGSEIAIARDSDAYNKHRGIHGDVDFSVINDNGGTITLTLKHTSESNKLLTRLFNKRERFSCYVVDGNESNKEKDGGGDCVIMKPADKSKGEEIGEREWIIGVPNLVME